MVCMLSNLISSLLFPYISHFPAEHTSIITEYKSSQKFPMGFILFHRVELFCGIISQISIFYYLFRLCIKILVVCYSTVRSRGIILHCENKGN